MIDETKIIKNMVDDDDDLLDLIEDLMEDIR